MHPFKRLGDNTVLFTLDRHEKECPYNFNRNGGNESSDTLKQNTTGKY